MSRHEIGQQSLADIAAACNVSPEQIDDIYACTPLQTATMAESTIHAGASIFQFILNLSPSVDQDQFCSSLQHVVSLNAVLRTRLVDTSGYTGSDSNAFGVVLSGRTSTCPAAETTLGPTIAIVPVQVNLQSSMTIEAILKDRAAARRQLQIEPSLQYGLTRIRAVSDAARIASGFQTLMNIRPRWYDPKEASEVTYDDMKEPSGAFALSLSIDLEDGGVSVEAVVDPTVIPEQQLRRILDQFEHLLRSLTEAPLQTKLEKIPRLSPSHLSEIRSWNHALPKLDEICIHDLFRAQARAHPASAAVEAWDGCATYAQLDDISDRLAHTLRQRGISNGSLVAFIFEKSFWTVVALLGIMKAGGACVPISTADPLTRKAAVISAAGIKIILTSSAEYDSSISLAPNVIEVSESSISGLPNITSPLDVKDLGDPGNLAFVIFTSGSTGVPKGVMLEHRNLASSLRDIARRLDWRPGQRVLQFASYVWDIHIGESFGAILFGGCLCIPSDEDRNSRLAQFINSSRIDCMWLTPTVIRTLSPNDVPGVKMLISAGEALVPDASRTWGKCLRLINGWGPCEGSVISAMAELTPDSPYPETIGTPLNGSLWIANPKKTDELVPIGAVGEILIDGAGVARGYLGDEAKIRASFIKPPPWALYLGREDENRRLYRTGDLARYNPDGSICFIGRRDNQVKIRGQRLELGELESVLGSLGEVRDVVTTTKIIDGRTHLVAVVSLADEHLPSEGLLQEIPGEHAETVTRHLRTIRDHARFNLPPYMVPTVWLAVEKMPQTASAKLDRVSVTQWLKTKKDLSPARAAMDAALAEALIPPRTAEEKVLRSVWASVLNIPEAHIGCESCFISLGGDSILAMQAASQCLKRGVATTTAALLKNTPLVAIADAAVKSESHNGTSKLGPAEAQVNLDSEQAAAILNRFSSLNIQSLERHNVEAIVPATDGQAVMLAVGEMGGRGYYIDFVLQCSPSLDAARLRNACEQVVKHHAILRTKFVQHGSRLYQVVLKDGPANTIELRVPLKNMTCVSWATPSSVVKAAWALLLSYALGIRDVVFGEVSANRYLALPGVDQVRGPCVNQVPVRARLDPSMELASLVGQIHDLHTSGMPHHHLGTRSIIRDCTAWPSWTRFSTSLVYQNHASIGKTVKIGDTDCELSVNGQLGDSTDIHLIATPDPDREELEIALRYSPLTFPAEQIRWISRAFAKILELFPSALEQNLGQVEAALSSTLDSRYIIPTVTGRCKDLVGTSDPPSETLNDCQHSVSAQSKETVLEAWKELELLPESPKEDGDYSMWDSGGDIVTALLLSENYRSRGYNISSKEIVENPTYKMQLRLADLKKPEMNRLEK
ncbi:putative NRPS-like protein biosynthetic cluster [Amphichorda felina]